MSDDKCQRWTRRRDSYRPAGEPIDPSRYGVELIAEQVARDFVVREHYSGSYPAARCRVGLFRSTGASWWAPRCSACPPAPR